MHDTICILSEAYIEVKPHKREVCRPMMRKYLPVEETYIYPEGINRDEYTEIRVETTQDYNSYGSNVH